MLRALLNIRINYCSFHPYQKDFHQWKKTIKIRTYDELETTVLQWVSKGRREGHFISRPIVAMKPKQFFEILDLVRGFYVSSRWLIRFKPQVKFGFTTRN